MHRNNLGVAVRHSRQGATWDAPIPYQRACICIPTWFMIQLSANVHPGKQQQWLKHLGPCHLRGSPGWSARFLALAWLSASYATFEKWTNGWKILFLFPFLSLLLFQMSKNKYNFLQKASEESWKTCVLVGMWMRYLAVVWVASFLFGKVLAPHCFLTPCAHTGMCRQQSAFSRFFLCLNIAGSRLSF